MDRNKDGKLGEPLTQPLQEEPYSLKSSQPMSKSLKFTKRLTAIIFSVITYERKVFSKNAYTDKHFSKLKLPVLSGRPDCSDAYQVTTHLRNALYAVDKGYLKDLILDFLGADGSILESFSISYDYEGVNLNVSKNASGFSSSQFDKQTFIDSIEELFVSLKQTLKQHDPPSKVDGIRFRIAYHTRRTPETYLPQDYFDLNQGDEEMSTGKKEIGNVVLPFHSMALGVHGGISAVPRDVKKICGEPATKGNQGSHAVNPIGANVNCVCRMNEKTNGVFECYNCNDWHHLICYKRKTSTIIDPGDKRVCYNCAKQDSKLACLDGTLSASVPPKNIQNLVVCRQVINELSCFEKIDVKKLSTISRLSEKQMNQLVGKLLKKHLLVSTSELGIHAVQKGALLKFIDSYFV